jgi:hypothetical protein
MNSGLTSTEMQVVFLKELFTSITSELVALNTELGNAILQPQQLQQPSDNSSPAQFVRLNYQNPLSIAVAPDSASSMIDQQFKNLINKCMGDVEKAERLIQYEHQRYPELDRKGAIQSAITRWESDNR